MNDPGTDRERKRQREERTGYRSGQRPVPRSTPAHPGGTSGSDSGTPILCDLCGATMMELHCKLVCLSCGYQRDCSDP